MTETGPLPKDLGHPHTGYPPQLQPGYPPSYPLGQPVAYPQAGYPMQQQAGYPPQQQPGYPPAYPPQEKAGYPQQPQTDVPPPSKQPSIPPQRSQPINRGLQQQRTTVTTVFTRRYGSGDHGLVYAISSSCIVFWCAGWVGLVCTIPAIFIALLAQHSEANGDLTAMKFQHYLSYGLSSAGLITGFLFLFIWIISSAT